MFCIIVFVIVCIFVFTPLFDGKTFSDYNGKYSYDDLFSSKTETADMGNMIQILLYNDYIFEEIEAKSMLYNIEFEAISPLKTVLIMTLYDPMNKLCSVSTLTFGSVLDKYEISDENVLEISKATDYIVEGTLFTFGKSVYMFATIKDNSYVYDAEDTGRENAIRSTMGINNKTISLFKLNNIDEHFISEFSSKYEVASNIKPYPNWYAKIQEFFYYKTLTN